MDRSGNLTGFERHIAALRGTGGPDDALAVADTANDEWSAWLSRPSPDRSATTAGGPVAAPGCGTNLWW